MKNVNITLSPTHFTFISTSKEARPDMRLIAREFAEYILQNGFITHHELNPHRSLSSDAYEWRFHIYTYKPERGLP